MTLAREISGHESTYGRPRRFPHRAAYPYNLLVDGWLSGDELLQRVPIGGERPDAALKRLRRADLLPRPVAVGRGRGRGVRQLYPPGTDLRLQRIVELRRAGVRAERELRWWLWYEGDDGLWQRVQRDLLEAFPAELEASVLELTSGEEEPLFDAIEVGAHELARDWEHKRYPAYDRRRVRSSVETRDLAMISIEAALPGVAPDLDAPLDSHESPERLGDLPDRAWGAGSGETLAKAIASGAVDSTRWRTALAQGTAAQARVIASLWLRAFPSRAKARRELDHFGSDWSDRALLVGSQLLAVQLGLGPP
jgi:hypothetical protein